MAAVSILHFWAYPYHVYEGQPSAKAMTNNNGKNDNQHATAQGLVTHNHERQSQHLDISDDSGVWDGTARSPQPAELGFRTRKFQWQALVDALNFTDIFWAVVRAPGWLFAEQRKTSDSFGPEGAQNDNGIGMEFTGQSRETDLSQALLVVDRQNLGNVQA